MSTYRATSVIIDPTIIRRQRIRGLVDTYFTGECLVTAASLQASALPQLTGTATDNLQARLTSLTAERGGLSTLLQCSTPVNRIQQLAARASALASTGDPETAERLVGEANLLLSDGVDRAVSLLRTDERRLLAAEAVDVLQDMGFTVRSSEGSRSTGIWAERGHHVMAALATDDGQAFLDHAGLVDGGCVTVTSEFCARMSERGFDMRMRESHEHDDASGGALIRRAAKTGNRSLEQALVDQYEVDTRTTRRPAPQQRIRNQQGLGR